MENKTLKILRSYQWIYFLGLFLLHSFYAISQSNIPNLKLNHAGLGQGLSHRNVTSIVKDDYGYLWVATESGLNKYNGKNFKNFTSFTSDLKDDNIEDLFKDQDGFIWLIHGSIYNQISIEILDPFRESFHDFMEIYPNNKSLVEGEIIFYRKQNNKAIFLTKQNEIIIYDGQFYHISLAGLAHEKILNLILNDSNDFLLSYKKEKDGDIINRIYDSKGHFKKEYIHQENVNYTHVYKTDSNFFYYFIINEKLKEIHYYKMDISGSVFKDQDAAIRFKDIKEYLAISTIHDVLNYSDEYLLFSIRDIQGLHHFESHKTFLLKDLDPEMSSLHEIYYDGSGIYWLASHFGLFALQIYPNYFQVYLKKPNQQNSIRNFAVQNDSTLWVLKDKISQIYRLTFNRDFPNSFALDSLTNLLPDSRKLTWTLIHTLNAKNPNKISFMMNGSLVTFDPVTFNYRSYPILNGDEKNYAVWLLHFDNYGRLWIGDDRANLYCKTATESFKAATLPHYSSLSNIYYIHEYQHNLYFIATDAGLFEFDPENKQIKSHFTKEGKGKYYLPCQSVYHIRKIKEDSFWLATDNGLMMWSPNQGVIQQFDVTKGLSSNTIYAVYPDEYGALWLPSAYGLMRMDTENDAIETFLEENGISNNEFNRLAHISSPNGNLYFGSMNGITVIHPKDFLKIDKHGGFEIRIKKIEQFFKSEYTTLNVNNEIIKKEGLVMKESTPFVKLEIDLLTFDFESGEKLSYKIEGLDDTWHYIDRNYIQINRLPFGNYRLIIRGIDHKGQYSNNQIELPIHSIKPFYKQTWFLILLIILILISIVIFFWYRESYLRKRNKMMEEIIKQRTDDILSNKMVIEAQAKKLKKTNESKDIFINNIAHELRTPLTLIKGPIDMILKNKLKKDIVQRMLKSIQFNSNKLSSLVEDLVQISLLDKGARKSNPEFLYLYKFICDIISSMEFIAMENGVRIKLKYNIDKDLYYKIDKNFLEKILTNLLSNAMKFTRDESEIFVVVDEKDNELYIRVKDQGSGVKKVDRKKIFQRYYQTDILSKKQGLGIGLNYSLSLAKRMGGDLVLEKTSSHGSTFLLRVPVRSTKPKIKEYDITNKLMEDQKANKRKLKVLIVEDNLELQKFIENVLKEHYFLYKANNGLEAQEFLETIKAEDLPDIIILDIMMPKMDGIELLKLIRAHPFFYNIPVIILSAKTDIKDKFTAFQIGIDDYITKPFNTDELLLRLNNTGKRIRKRKLFISQSNFNSELTDRDIGWLTSLQKCVVKNILNKQLNVNFIADELDVSRMQLSRKTKELMGITPKEYLKEIKLHYIREELNKGKSINRISKELGYSKASYIKKSYWERFGIEL